jgi:hypothetical protein
MSHFFRAGFESFQLLILPVLPFLALIGILRQRHNLLASQD